MYERIKMDDCITCCDDRIVHSLKDLAPGDHIKFGRFGCFMMWFLYYHHAIVVGVSRHKVEIVEFSKNENAKGFKKLLNKAVIKKNEKRIFDLKNENAVLVKYKKHPDRKSIVERAYAILDESDSKDSKPYNLLWNNCEHFALYCIFGQAFCLQMDLLNNIPINPQAMLILKCLNESITLLEKLNRGKIGSFALSSIPVVNISAILFSMHRYILRYKEGHTCCECFGSQIVCTVFYFISNVLLRKGISIGSTCVQLVFANVYYCLPSIICSVLEKKSDPHIENLRIHSFAGIKKGDIINYKLYKLPHDAVVVECRPVFNLLYVSEEYGREKLIYEDSYLQNYPLIRRLTINLFMKDLFRLEKYLKICENKDADPRFFWSILTQKHFISPRYQEHEIMSLDRQKVTTILKDNGVHCADNLSVKEMIKLIKWTIPESEEERENELSEKQMERYLAFFERHCIGYRKCKSEQQLRRLLVFYKTKLGKDNFVSSLTEDEVHNAEKPKLTEVLEKNNLFPLAEMSLKTCLKLIKYLRNHLLLLEGERKPFDLNETEISELLFLKSVEDRTNLQKTFSSDRFQKPHFKSEVRRALDFCEIQIKERLWKVLEDNRICYKAGKTLLQLQKLVVFLLKSSRQTYGGDGLEEVSIYQIHENDILIFDDCNGFKKCFVNSMQKSELDIVHYDFEMAQPGIIAFLNPYSRVVKRETISFNLDDDEIYVRRYFGRYNDLLYKEDDVVKNALSKVNQKEWRFFGYWSSHMCEECKMKGK